MRKRTKKKSVMTRRRKMNEVLGIDVSHHQGHIDWAQVRNAGKKFAIMKCQYEAQSHRKDEYFEYNYTEAGKQGIARGVYVYIARASIADPAADANSLLNHLKGRKLEYGIWLDLEDKSLEAKGKAYIRNLVYIYSDIFMKAGYFVGIYCNRDWYIRLIHNDLKQSFDFWIARYPKNDTGVYNKSSSLKPSFTIAVAWQYSSKGTVPGIPTKVDLDVDYDGIINLIAKGAEGKTLRDIALEVIDGKWGNGTTRRERLREAGYDYAAVQAEVNRILRG